LKLWEKCHKVRRKNNPQTPFTRTPENESSTKFFNMLNNQETEWIELHAGYILRTVDKTIKRRERGKREVWSRILEELCVFRMNANCSLAVNDSPDSVVAVLDGLISRGLPTYASSFVAEALKAPSPPFDEQSLPDAFRALCLLDSYHSPAKRLSLESTAERDFLENYLPARNLECLIPFMESQRPLDSIAKKYGKGQRVDFAIELPEINKNIPAHSLIIEIDGSQHAEETRQIIHDALRDTEARRAGWKICRISIANLSGSPKDIPEVLRKVALHPYIARGVARNIEKPFGDSPTTKKIRELMLIPMAIARLQKAICRMIMAGHIRFEKVPWKIAILERDFPFVKIAIRDFLGHLSHLFALEGKRRKPPEIQIDVIERNSNGKHENYDLAIDFSILSRYDVALDSDLFDSVEAAQKIVIRSGYTKREPRHFFGNSPVEYNVLSENFKPSLTHFLRWIYGHEEFREKQVDIIQRALQGKTVIGLLPTGSGKSLTYQLSALLQPGMAIVVDPIKSLMEDQLETLLQNRIDAATYINSNLQRKEREERLGLMSRGLFKFIFISPERFQIEEFREKLAQLKDQSKGHCPINYGVVDECHCVSEWGHDFRTAYLSIGKNMREFSKRLLFNSELPLVALTGTASLDVIMDVQKELEVENEESLVKPDDYDRKNLTFKIVKATPNTTENRPKSGFSCLKMDGEAKQKALLRELRKFSHDNSLSYFTDDKDRRCAIIFCPYVSSKTPFGVESVRNFLSDEFKGISGKIDFFAGSSDIREGDELSEIQRKFKDDEIRILVATKAFGMGVDKPNVFLTVHLNMPPSIEAFYQEAGRAGRDESIKSTCLLIYSGIKCRDFEGDVEISNDEAINFGFHNRSFRGCDRETANIREILDCVQWPILTQKEELEKSITDEFNVDARLNVWEKNNYIRLYVNGGGKDKFGYVDLRRMKVWVQDENEKSSGILNWVMKSLGEAGLKSEVDVIRWLDEKVSAEFREQPNLWSHLEKMNPGDTDDFVIPFNNGEIERIEGYLGKGYRDRTIRKAAAYASDKSDFSNRLAQYYRYHSDSDDTRKQLEESFVRIRNSIDTDKAVYRFMLIGVVEDYTKDYTRDIINMKVRKRTDEQYVQNLKKYLLSWEPKRRVSERLGKLGKLSGRDLLEECFDVLIKFVYDHIRNKRRTAIENMAQAVRDNVKDPQSFKNRLLRYFDSKYFEEVNQFEREKIDFEELEKFLRKINTEPGLWKEHLQHLEGACARHLESKTEYGAYFVLLSYARFGLTTFEEEKKKIYENLMEAQNKFEEGRRLLRENGMTRKEGEEMLEWFQEGLLEHEPQLKEFFLSIFLKETTEWISKCFDRITDK